MWKGTIVTRDKFNVVKDGDLISVWITGRSGHRAEFHDWDEKTPCLMRVLYRCGDLEEFVVAVPFSRNGRWANTTVWADRVNVVRTGHDDGELIAKAEADMPRFRREFVKQVCRENERLLRTSNKELMRSLCAVGARPEDFDGIMSGCPGDDIEGITVALAGIAELESQWEPSETEEATSDTQERFEKALDVVRDTLDDAPASLGSVLRRTDDNSGDGSGDIREIAVFCGTLAAEMQDGGTKAYLIRLQAVMEEYAEAWDSNEP